MEMIAQVRFLSFIFISLSADKIAFRLFFMNYVP
jgi:hypothetical protein